MMKATLLALTLLALPATGLAQEAPPAIAAQGRSLEALQRRQADLVIERASLSFLRGPRHPLMLRNAHESAALAKIIGTTAPADTMSVALRQRMDALAVERVALAETYGARHPRMQRNAHESALIAKSLAAGAKR